MLRFLSSSRPFLIRATATASASAPAQSTITSSSWRAFATKAAATPSLKKKVSMRSSSSTAAAKETARALAAQKRQQKKEQKERAAQKQAELRERLRARAQARKAKEAEAKQRLQARRVALRERRLATVAKARERAQWARAEKKLQPKQPGSAFSLFVKQRSPAMYKEVKNLAEVGRRLAAEWKTLASAQKKPFQDESDARRAKYAAEQATKPKRPPNTYMSFLQKERAALPQPKSLAESQQQVKQLVQKWKQLTPQEKARYAPSPSALASYARAKEQYDAKHAQQVEQYIQQHAH